MSSRAWLLPNVRSRLVGSVSAAAAAHICCGPRRRVQVYQTPCLVLGDNLDGCDTLINPANPGLTGTSNFSYFPRGGPVPKHTTTTKRWFLLRDVHPIMGYVSRWGDVDVSRGLLLPENVLDGLVHQHAGWRLRGELCFVKRMSARLSAVVGNTSSTEPCPVGRGHCRGHIGGGVAAQVPADRPHGATLF